MRLQPHRDKYRHSCECANHAALTFGLPSLLFFTVNVLLVKLAKVVVDFKVTDICL